MARLMKGYKVERTAYDDLCGEDEWTLYERRYSFFGLIPSGWTIVLCSQNGEDIAEWINENIFDITTRIELKQQI